ncbi:hypothetical protein TTHERM_000127179 (macronuclear) [Tetrahymena thermophila SB210]|uniref:Uncharacterized protein n=1 Tax=Tetrahymena thermophila (strain SB210) TaxID=312017 RepID=W7XJU3_TETTS|nr:hypothetical protein TTHERM_000127179 [Tetrahymena thermophila SB210]EWS74334.1 hypothetical protein TTHERM_000127179 [Tetrahymena thermophila SB210]|eukprot:XP_012653155.1 hypothetical protein TTHERM_000127179 [Tetrahymena thermophila SB210]
MFKIKFLFQLFYQLQSFYDLKIYYLFFLVDIRNIVKYNSSFINNQSINKSGKQARKQSRIFILKNLVFLLPLLI